jgi:hypothetical protein
MNRSYLIADLSSHFGTVLRLTRTEHKVDGRKGIVAECRTRNTATMSYWMVTTQKPAARCYVHIQNKIAEKFDDWEAV